MELGNKIRQLRFKASLTQEQLAERLGLSAQAVSKWENSVAMPDITLLPDLAEIFGVSIDELFDLTTGQKYRRIESRMDTQDELEPDVFREYETFLREQIRSGEDPQKANSVLAHLYYHAMEAYARKADACAREAIRLNPGKKDCQWLLQKTEGSAAWDWNITNHSRTIAFYRQLIEDDTGEPKKALPYLYLIDNLIADHRAEEAEAYLERYKKLPGCKAFIVPTYEAAIALARFDEARADAIMEKALADFHGNSGMLFEAAQYYAGKCDYGRAMQCYEASYAAETDRPRFTDALDSIAAICEITGDLPRAIRTQERILRALREEWGFSEETIIRETEMEIERLRKKAQSGKR